MATRATAQRRRLGAELRRLRERARATSERAAERLDCHVSKISRIELGQSPIRRLDLEALLDLYGIANGRERDALLRLASVARTKGWWQSYADVLPATYADFIGLEVEAAWVNSFEMVLIPGLLQTADYARTVITQAWDTESSEQVDRLVEVRTLRQQLLAPPAPLRMHVVLCESALRQCIGGVEIMRAQLVRLVEASRLPHVTLQILQYAAGAHPGLNGSFTVMGFEEEAEPDVVLVENWTSSLYFEDRHQLARYKRAFQNLKATAAPPCESASLIEKTIEELA